MEPFFSEDIRKRIEALLFVAGEPLTEEDLAKLVECSPETATGILDALQEFYKDCGFQLMRIAGGWQFMTKKEMNPYVERLYQPKAKSLSKAAMETLAIIAYCQPVTRGDIEEIRGVNADSIVSNLLEKGLIHDVGRRETPGKPVIYGTTDKFLQLLSIDSLEDLPQVGQEE